MTILPSPMDKDRDIVHLWQSGKEEAIKQLFDLYYIDLCIYADSILKDRFAAEEVVEELFVNLWLKARELKIHTSVKKYLYQSVHNNSIKYLKKKATEGKHLEKFRSQDISEIYGDESNVEIVNLITREMEEKANEILAQLPDKCRKIYELNRYENLSYPEIAKTLNITVGTVKTQMSRAFEKFRNGLKEFLAILVLFLIS